MIEGDIPLRVQALIDCQHGFKGIHRFFVTPLFPLPETVVAEKLEALVKLDAANSRMRDFYDLLTLAGQFSFESTLLCKAIEATFERRQTVFPSSVPLALTKEFAATKQKLWEGFLKRSKLEETEVDFSIVVQAIDAFLRKPMDAIAKGGSFKQTWSPGRSWK